MSETIQKLAILAIIVGFVVLFVPHDPTKVAGAISMVVGALAFIGSLIWTE